VVKAVFSKEEDTAITAYLAEKRVQDTETSHKPVTNIYLISECTARSLNSATFQATLTNGLYPERAVAILHASLAVHFLARNPRYKQATDASGCLLTAALKEDKHRGGEN